MNLKRRKEELRIERHNPIHSSTNRTIFNPNLIDGGFVDASLTLDGPQRNPTRGLAPA